MTDPTPAEVVAAALDRLTPTQIHTVSDLAANLGFPGTTPPTDTAASTPIPLTNTENTATDPATPPS
ncbi:hypothetical protein ACFXPM_31765 [Streptomyces sp. NPDC059095]|uniref:hypothetical protein n=1 Tax=Streptomyces sp. NPDC059095 TaxID=3346726 RepID=UPI00368F4EFA